MKYGLLRIAIGDPGRLSVCFTPCKHGERIEILPGMETLGDLRNIVIDESPDFSQEFDAAFAKLLWLFVVLTIYFKILGCKLNGKEKYDRFCASKVESWPKMVDNDENMVRMPTFQSNGKRGIEKLNLASNYTAGSDVEIWLLLSHLLNSGRSAGRPCCRRLAQ